ncbi:hypothetical protein J4444_01235 [Candidatus Woesearchaeota archaeon]|nr:hypothetical protein [Candidatus Woesearchaeota archaeon]
MTLSNWFTSKKRAIAMAVLALSVARSSTAHAAWAGETTRRADAAAASLDALKRNPVNFSLREDAAQKLLAYQTELSKEIIAGVKKKDFKNATLDAEQTMSAKKGIELLGNASTRSGIYIELLGLGNTLSGIGTAWADQIIDDLNHGRIHSATLRMGEFEKLIEILDILEMLKSIGKDKMRIMEVFKKVSEQVKAKRAKDEHARALPDGVYEYKAGPLYVKFAKKGAAYSLEHRIVDLGELHRIVVTENGDLTVQWAAASKGKPAEVTLFVVEVLKGNALIYPAITGVKGK